MITATFTPVRSSILDLDTPALRQRTGSTRPGWERIAEIRRQIAGGTYLAERADEKLAAVVEGLWRDLEGAGRAGLARRAAG